MTAPLVVIGDSMLDRDVDGSVDRLAPDAPVPVVDETSTVPRPGGAALAAALMARDGIRTVLVTALGADQAGAELSSLLAAEGVEVLDIGATGATPEKIRIRTEGRPIVRLDRGGHGCGQLGEPDAAVGEAVAGAAAVLVSDYGRGMTAHQPIRRLLSGLTSTTPVVWDPHPRGSVPVTGCRMVTPNRSEAARFVPEVDGDDLGAVEERARRLLARWSAHGVAITLGQGGALFVDGSPHPVVAPAATVAGGDPCGAGDRFAGTLARELANGTVPSEAVGRSVWEAARFVASGGAGSVRPGRSRPVPSVESDAVRLAARIRDQGGTVVATGGCFDLLHAGHVAMLEAARRLGDCLIVCLNSDRSVTALKGDSRPVNPCDDRRAVLSALASVDAVEVFDDDLPIEVLQRIRPHIWAKGGDYGAEPLPEAPVLESWGGRIAILPYLRGRSTTQLLEQAARS